MTKTEKNFIPMLLLASGSFGSSADATIILKNFAVGGTILDINSTGAYLVNVAGADTKYSIRSVTTQTGAQGKKSLPVYTTNSYFNSALQSDGYYSVYNYFSSDDRIGTAADSYTIKESSALPQPSPAGPGAMLYAQLRFRLDGIETYGVVGVQDAKIKSVKYEVLDAVPEPAVWAEMIVGLGAVGAAMRRRRRSARSLAA